MATLISANGGGNWTTLGTWRNACTGGGAALLTLTAAESKTNTTYTYGVAFTVTNAEVVEGFALHLQRSGTTGTLTVALSEDNGTTATREVTVNLSDLPSAYSWVFFKFGSTLTADGGSDYKVGIKLSSGSSGVSIYRGSATAGDWSHLLREDSAPGSLADGDVFYIMDALTGAGAKTANTVTMNNTDTTDFGAVTVGFGTLTFGTAAATNYYLRTSGDVTVWGGGTLNIGTVGVSMPADSTAVLEFDPTSDGEFGLIVKDGGTLVAQGNPMTKVWTLLNANAAANATSLTTADSTGWKDNDRIVIASTSRTPGETEAGALNGNASGTTLTVDGFGGTSGGVAYAHAGSATGGPGNTDIRAEIVNLTRNVKFRSSSSTIMTFLYIAATATVDFDYVEIYYVGENASTKRGLEIATSSAGSCSVQYCSIHDTEDFGLYVSSVSGSITFSWNVLYNLNTAKPDSAVYIGSTSGAHTISYNVFLSLQCGNPYSVIIVSDNGSVFTYNRFAGMTTGAYGLHFAETAPITGTIEFLVYHSNYAQLTIANARGGIISNCLIWRNSQGGIYPMGNFGTTIYNTTLFGNGNGNIWFYQGISNYSITFLSGAFDGDVSYSTNYGAGAQNSFSGVIFKDCTFGTNVAHSVRDINFGGSGYALIVNMYNCTLASSNEISTLSNSLPNSVLRSHKHNASTAHKTFYFNGTVFSDQNTRHTESGYAWKLAPSSVIYKLVFPGPYTSDTFGMAVVAGAAVTITAWVRKDSSYSGNAPRLVLVGGYIGGIPTDVVDSLSVGADTWEQLSVSGTPNEAGVVEWYVDCDGTAGSVYVDDMAVSQSGLPSADNLDYVSWGLPLMAPYTLGAAAAGGLLVHPGMSGGMRG